MQHQPQHDPNAPSVRTNRIVAILVLVLVALGIVNSVYYIMRKKGLFDTKQVPQTDSTISPRTPQAALPRQLNPANTRALDSAIGLLQTGDLVLRTGADATSYLLRQINQTDKTYSHCGMVVVEDGYPFVYHSVGGEDQPLNAIARDSAIRFCSPVANLGIGLYRLELADAQRQAVAGVLQQFFKEKRTFDMDFDLSTDDRLYCAEYLYKAIVQATGDTGYFELTRMAGRSYVAVDNLFQNPRARAICQVQFK